MSKNKEGRFFVRLDPLAEKALRRFSEENMLSISSVIRMAIIHYQPIKEIMEDIERKEVK